MVFRRTADIVVEYRSAHGVADRALHHFRQPAKTLRKIERSRHTDGRWEIRFDSDFEAVMRACAAPRKHESGTWISEDIIRGYCGLHRQGFAHSSEVWLEGELVGGAYGVSIGQMFYGESMFARVSDGSKVALAYLVHFLRRHGVRMIDCQQETPHLASLGAAPISRQAFLTHLRSAIRSPQIGFWHPLDLFSPDSAGQPPAH